MYMHYISKRYILTTFLNDYNDAYWDPRVTPVSLCATQLVLSLDYTIHNCGADIKENVYSLIVLPLKHELLLL